MVEVYSWVEVMALPKTYEAVGTTEDGTTIVLETPLPVRGRVKVQIYTEAGEWEDVPANREAILQAIHERQCARGHKPTPVEEVEAYIRRMRSEDDDAANLS